MFTEDQHIVLLQQFLSEILASNKTLYLSCKAVSIGNLSRGLTVPIVIK